MQASDLIYFLPGFAIFYMLFLLWRRARHRKINNEEPAEPIDFVLLNEADRIAARQPSMLEQYMDRYVAVGKFSTVQAFGTQDMERLVAELEKIDVEARYLLIETMPAGAMTVLGPAGYYQLWVEPRDESKTKEFLKREFGKEF